MSERELMTFKSFFPHGIRVSGANDTFENVKAQRVRTSIGVGGNSRSFHVGLHNEPAWLS